MREEGRFTPRLGHIGPDDRSRAAKQARSLARKGAQARSGAGKPARLAPGTIRCKGRGKGAAATAALWAHTFSRRVVVRIHVSWAGPAPNAAFNRYLSYIRRDGTERDGSRGRMYTRSEDETGVRAFNQRARHDTHQFRVIVSPEDGAKMKDLKAFTRTLMAQTERDLGTQLDWVAVNHYDTAHPHVHIVLRGADADNGELFIDRKYLCAGMRHRAQEIVTRELGQRHWREIMASRAREIEKNDYTSIDQDLDQAAAGNKLTLARPGSALERYELSLRMRRLRHLERLGLAEETGPGQWRLEPGWAKTLRSLGPRRINRSRSMTDPAHATGPGHARLFPALAGAGGRVQGRLAGVFRLEGRHNEAEILIEGVDGQSWIARLPKRDVYRLPARGSVVTLSARPVAINSADRTIAEIARRHGGLYSDALLSLKRPDTSPAHHLAHRRRLEVLSRSGIVARSKAGAWTIPDDFMKRARLADAKQQTVSITVQSFLPIEQLTGRQAFTWLDEIDREFPEAGFGAEVNQARRTRRAWLQSQGLDLSARSALQAEEFEGALAAEIARRGRSWVELSDKACFRGVYSGHLDIARARFAIIESEGKMTAVPWSGQHAHLKGRLVEITKAGKTIHWSPERERRLG